MSFPTLPTNVVTAFWSPQARELRSIIHAAAVGSIPPFADGYSLVMSCVNCPDAGVMSAFHTVRFVHLMSVAVGVQTVLA